MLWQTMHGTICAREHFHLSINQSSKIHEREKSNINELLHKEFKGLKKVTPKRNPHKWHIFVVYDTHEKKESMNKANTLRLKHACQIHKPRIEFIYSFFFRSRSNWIWVRQIKSLLPIDVIESGAWSIYDFHIFKCTCEFCCLYIYLLASLPCTFWAVVL